MLHAATGNMGGGVFVARQVAIWGGGVLHEALQRNSHCKFQKITSIRIDPDSFFQDIFFFMYLSFSPCNSTSILKVSSRFMVLIAIHTLINRGKRLPPYWNHVSVLYCSYSKVGTARTVTLPLFWAVPFAVLRIRSTRNNKWSSPQGSSSAWVYQYTCTKKIYSTFTLPNHDRITWTFLRCRQLAKAHVYP